MEGINVKAFRDCFVTAAALERRHERRQALRALEIAGVDSGLALSLTGWKQTSKRLFLTQLSPPITTSFIMAGNEQEVKSNKRIRSDDDGIYKFLPSPLLNTNIPRLLIRR